MTDSEINAIIAQAAIDNPAVRADNIARTSTITSEEAVEDAHAAFLEALGETEDVNLGVQMESEHPETEEEDMQFNPESVEDVDYEIRVDNNMNTEEILTEISDITGISEEEIRADAEAAIRLSMVNSLMIGRPARNLSYTRQEPMSENGFEDNEDEEEEEVTDTPLHEEEVEETTIPVNSASTQVDETTSRFSDAIWYNKIQEKVITLAGLGGIGSYVAFLLSRMKPRAIYLYDDDEVEAANMSGQLYGKQDFGHKKVNAMATMVSNYADYGSIFAMPEKFTYDSEASDIMICGFDNMKARQTFYDMWLSHLVQIPFEQRKNCLFIDGRLAAESIQVFCITGDDDYNQSKYKKDWLFTDIQADVTMCSYKQTTFCANMIGSIMTNLFVNFCANECNPLIPRDLPFMTSYEAETMYFKTEN